MSVLKACNTCGEEKPLDAFSRQKQARDGRLGQCRACRGAKRRAAYWQNPEPYRQKRRDHIYRYRYGLSRQEVARLIAKQGNRCAICGREGEESGTDKLCVDHCHGSKAVRKMLCRRCNMGLGFFEEDIQAMEAAINYLKETR